MCRASRKENTLRTNSRTWVALNDLIEKVCFLHQFRWTSRESQQAYLEMVISQFEFGTPATQSCYFGALGDFAETSRNSAR